MTISTTASTTIVLGDGSNTSFSFSFIADSADFIEVIYTDTTGAQTTLSPSQYTLIINPASAGQLWGVGGTVTYPNVGSPIAVGTSLTISRILPFTQTITISNQGDFAPQVIEEMGDTLEMQIQQLAARTGQLRGTWTTDTAYTFGDVVVDGANGENTGNFYMCVIANTSGVWADDLAAGDWSLAISVNIPNAPLPLSIANGGTGATTASAARTALGLGTAALENTSSVIADNGAGALTIGAAQVTNAMLATMPGNTIKLNSSMVTATPSNFTLNVGQLLGVGASGAFSSVSANTYTANIAAPAGTLGGNGVMMGLAGTLIPNFSGKVRATISGTAINSSTGGFFSQIYYGTGTAPTNGATSTGTSTGSNVTWSPSATGSLQPFINDAIISGLTLGTPYWFDLSFGRATNVGSASATSLTVNLSEIK